MSFPGYPSYQESGVEWAPSLPANWSSAPLRWLATRYAGGTPDRNRQEFWENGTIPWLNSGSVNQGLVQKASAFITEEALAQSSTRWVPAGALLMALAGQGKTKGMVAQLAFPATCNQSMAAIVPGSELVPRYLLWWLSANYQNIRNMAGGDNRDGLNLELLATIRCPLPTLPDQTTIAAFLDRETAKIDALVEEQRRLIELLKEKRQAVISHAVTKGLDPTVPMKESGVEWLDVVPAHWQMMRLKDLCEDIVDCKNRTPDQHDDGEYLVVRTSCIKDGKFDPAGGYYTDYASYLEWTKKGLPKQGDVLFTREAPAGEACLAPSEIAFCLGQRMMFLRADTAKCLPEYLLYNNFGPLVREVIASSARGSTVSHLRVGEVGELRCLVPPLSEQKSIVSHLGCILGKMDRLSDQAENARTLLLEHRAALISAAVTGKIDVRAASFVEAA